MLKLPSAAFFGVLVLCVGSALASGGGEEAPHSVPNFVWFHTFNLLLLLVILYRTLRRPVRDFLIKRSDSVRDSIEKADAAKREALELKATYEARMAKLDEEMERHREETEEVARKEAKQIIESAHASAARLEADTKRLFKEELVRARFELRQEAVGIALKLARELLASQITKEDQHRLMEQYFRQVTQTTELN